MESILTLLKITRMAYLVIIGPNPRENMSSWSRLLRIIRLAHRKSYLVIICPNSQEQLTKTKRSSGSQFSIITLLYQGGGGGATFVIVVLKIVL